MKLRCSFQRELLLLTTFTMLTLFHVFAQDGAGYQEIADIDGADLRSPAWSPDGTRLAVVDFPAINIFNTTDWDSELIIFEASANEVVWSPDGSQLASVAGGDNEQPYESLYIRNAYTGEVEIPLLRPYEGATDYLFILPMARLSWSPDGMSIASDSHALDVLIWDLESEQVHTLGSHKSGRVGVTDWSPDSSQVVSEGGDGTIRIWDVASRENEVTVEGGVDVDWHPTESKIVGARFDHNVCIWDTNTGKQLLCLEHENTALFTRWNIDGSMIATGDLDGIIRIWDAQTGDIIVTIEEHMDLITGLAWHPHENLLASASYDDVRVWQINR